MMINLFSTREIATAVWFVLIIIFFLFYPKNRKLLFGIVRSAFAPKLLIPFIFLMGYTILFIYGFTFLSIWKWSYAKDIIVWFFFAGVPFYFEAIIEKIDKHYFRDNVFGNLKFIVLVEFLISTFTFSFCLEFFIVPFVTFLSMVDIFVDGKPEYIPIKKLVSIFMILIGFLFIAFSLKNAIVSYVTLNTVDLLVSFFIPIVFSLACIPIVYLFALYAKYEILFIRMGIYESKSSETKKK